jgi:hypothetical protein
MISTDTHDPIDEETGEANVEFSRLMQRAGIAPKPDVRLDVQPPWDPPKDLDDLTRTEPDDDDAEGDYDLDAGYVPEEGDEPEGDTLWEE